MAAPALELRAVSMRFGRTEVLRGIDLAVASGECLGLIGPNGAGKSTLFNVVSGRHRPSGGSVLLQGRRIDGLAPHRIHGLGLARSFQRSELFGRLSVLDHLRCAALQGQGASLWRRLGARSGVEQRARALLGELGLAAAAEAQAQSLGHAQQRALELGMALAGDAPVVLLDEPTAGMGHADSTRFAALIRRLAAGRTLLVVEHDMEVVFGLADRIAVLDQGRLLACGAPAAVRADPAVRSAYLGLADAGEAQDAAPAARAPGAAAC